MTALVILMFATYGVLTLLGRTVAAIDLSPSSRARVVLAVVFVNTGLSHFYDAPSMLALLPPFAPLPLVTVYASGAFEIVAGIALLVPRTRKVAATALLAFLIAAFPLNVYGALNGVPIGGHETGPVYLLLRTPFQLLLAGMTVALGLRPQRIPSVDTTRRASTA